MKPNEEIERNREINHPGNLVINDNILKEENKIFEEDLNGSSKSSKPKSSFFIKVYKVSDKLTHIIFSR